MKDTQKEGGNHMFDLKPFRRKSEELDLLNAC